MDCPVCRIPMLVVEKLDVELDCCAGCGGVWFDEDELEVLLGSTGLAGGPELVAGLLEAPAAPSNEKKRRCPRCSKAMNKVRLEGDANPLLDLCRAGDGFWLDRGELAQVAAALDGSTPERERLAAYLGGLMGGSPQEPPGE